MNKWQVRGLGLILLAIYWCVGWPLVSEIRMLFWFTTVIVGVGYGMMWGGRE